MHASESWPRPELKWIKAYLEFHFGLGWAMWASGFANKPKLYLQDGCEDLQAPEQPYHLLDELQSYLNNGLIQWNSPAPHLCLLCTFIFIKPKLDGNDSNLEDSKQPQKTGFSVCTILLFSLGQSNAFSTFIIIIIFFFWLKLFHQVRTAFSLPIWKLILTDCGIIVLHKQGFSRAARPQGNKSPCFKPPKYKALQYQILVKSFFHISKKHETNLPFFFLLKK